MFKFYHDYYLFVFYFILFLSINLYDILKLRVENRLVLAGLQLNVNNSTTCLRVSDNNAICLYALRL